jgi:hypothetical protein
VGEAWWDNNGLFICPGINPRLHPAPVSGEDRLQGLIGLDRVRQMSMFAVRLSVPRSRCYRYSFVHNVVTMELPCNAAIPSRGSRKASQIAEKMHMLDAQ